MLDDIINGAFKANKKQRLSLASNSTPNAAGQGPPSSTPTVPTAMAVTDPSTSNASAGDRLHPYQLPEMPTDMIGGTALNGILPSIFEASIPEVVVKLFHFWGFDSELNQIEKMLTKINLVHDDGERKMYTNKLVEKWVDNVKETAYEIDDAVDKMNVEVLRLQVERDFDMRKRSSFKKKMLFELKKLVDKLDELFTEASGYGLKSRNEYETLPPYWTCRSQTSHSVDVTEIYGRTDDKNRVMSCLFDPKDSENVVDEDTTARVMACCWGPGNPATTFVILDSSGEVLDVLYAGSISARGDNVNYAQRKKNDQERLLKFLTDYQPQVVVVGAANLSCTRLKDAIFEEIFNFFEHHAKDINPDIDSINVNYGDESIPRLYENSRIASDQLPGQPVIVKRAVALGRYLQNPLAMIATHCGSGREILSWKLTSSDDFLSPDEKYGVIEEVMVDANNHVGIDINLAASHEWLFAPLQFVSGLGPRKAYGLQRALVRAGSIFSRKEILLSMLLRRKEFTNAIGFLRVRQSGLAATSSQLFDLLDDTRIHPESYDLAKEMAKDVYNEEIWGTKMMQMRMI